MGSIRDLAQEELAETSMVDIVYALLRESNKEPQSFHDLLKEVANLRGFSTEEEKIEAMSQLYTEINVDGRFSALGDNRWGLRSWYPFEQAEEIVITDLKKKGKKKKSEDDDYEDFDDDFDGFDDVEADDLDEDLDDDLDDDLDETDEDLDDDLDEDLDGLDEVDDLDEDSEEDLDEELDELDEDEDLDLDDEEEIN